ncbi:hypothetical protein BDW42DRAFT_193766 [Aspergillus taichungensis]|uniref:NAD(P)-binding protein n=1 Tax=Aspergillus taichungensis TaxID=482145 RepID=A0A2J5HVI9_9EURO|nr:hypothetical protein BDW42DRAFT_193766 [Aspergillus taichungensis]
MKALLRWKQSYHIFLGAHHQKSQLTAKQLSSESAYRSVEPLRIDVESDESTNAAFKKITQKFNRVACLIHNAGACFDSYIGKEITARQAWNRTWDVNVSRAHAMTIASLLLLLNSQHPRLLFITGGLSSLQAASYSSNQKNVIPAAGLPKTLPFVGYWSAKAGLNMLMVEWAKALRKDGVKVWVVAPEACSPH